MVKLEDSLEKYSVVLLSAGRGKRIGKIGKKMPKCLIQIDKQTIISNLIKTLKLRGLKELNLVLGYKYKLILKEIKKIKNLKVNYIVVKDFINTGSVYSLYTFKNLWLKKKKKKPILMFHTDIIFDVKFLDNILLSKKNNLIGVKKITKNKLKKNSFVAKISKSMKILKIAKYKDCKTAYNEIICINKFSVSFFNKLLLFLNDYFKKFTNNITWEYPLSDFATTNNIHILKDQNFRWININTISDLNKARRKKYE
jgi:L-glutamine-phosphate cytidylyltransferase